MLWNNPISEQKFDRITACLELSAGERVVDVGCGAGEMLIRLVERFGVRGLGIDCSENALREARKQAALRVSGADLEWLHSDAKRWQAEPESFDLVICIGSTHAFGLGTGALERAIQSLAPQIKPGRSLLLGEGFLNHPADAEYRAILGEYPPDEATHASNIAVAKAQGLIPWSAWVSSADEWDEFEWAHQRATEQAAAKCPDDVQLCKMLSRRREWMQAYLRWGRDALGFGIYLLRKPG